MSTDIDNETSNKPSVLLVEDDEVTAYMLEYLLQGEGYKVTNVPDSMQAFAAINKNPPFSLALLDIWSSTPSDLS